MPETNGQVKCEAIEEINPLKLNVSIDSMSACYLNTINK